MNNTPPNGGNSQQKAQMIGGMYELFELIITIYDKNLSITFTRRDLEDKCTLCDSAISKNLTRLVKLGLLKRMENRELNGKRIYYTINMEVAYDFITNCLHK